MYSQSHFHSTTHEVLVVISGRAKLCFGGEENPERVEAELEKGDVMIVPAGVAHRLLVRTFPADYTFVQGILKPGNIVSGLPCSP